MKVPLVTKCPNQGGASTWIGAQSLSGKFIQVGVVENCEGKNPVQYEAFWSDTAQGYHPLFIGIVFPYNLVTVSMKQVQSGWSIKVVDKHTRLSDSQNISFAKGVHFNDGEWIQEDPTSSNVTATDLPYPTMSNPVFEKMKINGHAPHLVLKNGQVLTSSNGIIRVPTAVRNDSFTFNAPTGAAAQYMNDARGGDAAVSAFDVWYSQWKQLTVEQKKSALRNLVLSYTVFADELANQKWPASANSAVAVAVKSTRHVASVLDEWLASGLKDKGAAYSRYLALRGNHESSFDVLRAALGLPPA